MYGVFGIPEQSVLKTDTSVHVLIYLYINGIDRVSVRQNGNVHVSIDLAS